MSVELVEVPFDRSGLPFDARGGYKFDWRIRMTNPDKTTYFRVLRDGAEVARVRVDEALQPIKYVTAPDIWDTALKIQLVDVLEQYRRQGIGRAIVDHLSTLYSDYRLVAYSEDADNFWCGLGWDRHDHPDGRSRPLFIQPCAG